MNGEPIRCPRCGSFAWDYLHHVTDFDSHGKPIVIPGGNKFQCDDCGHVWHHDVESHIEAERVTVLRGDDAPPAIELSDEWGDVVVGGDE